MALSAFSGPALAEEDFSVNKFRGSVKEMVKLPVSGMVAATSDEFDGMIFMSENGRYVIRGQLYDIWATRPLNDMAEIRESATRISFDGLNLNLDDLGPLTYGNGPEKVTIFVDPNCPACQRVLKAMEPLAGKYTFRIMVIPALGGDSERRTVALSCAADRQAAARLLVAHADPQGLAQMDACNREPIARRMVTASLIGVKHVPFLIAADGRTHNGAPADLALFLQNKTAAR